MWHATTCQHGIHKIFLIHYISNLLDGLASNRPNRKIVNKKMMPVITTSNCTHKFWSMHFSITNHFPKIEVVDIYQRGFQSKILEADPILPVKKYQINVILSLAVATHITW